MSLGVQYAYNTEKKSKIRQLKNLVEKSKNLYVGSEEILLTKFLHFTKWDVHEAFASIRRYYEFKAEHPEWSAHHPVEYFRNHFLEAPTRFLMPKPDKDGRPIVIIKSVDAFGKFLNYMDDTIEMDDLMFEALLLLPRVQHYGLTVIFDLRGITFNFLRLLSPTIARLINERNTVLPFCCRVVHIIQSGFLISSAISMVMPFLNNDFKENIYIHDGKNFDKLREMVGYERLPSDYGGPETNKLCPNTLYEHLLKNSRYLLQIQTYKIIDD